MTFAETRGVIFICTFFRRIHVLLEEHALITQEGRKKPFKSLNVQLPEDVLENIKS